MVHLVQSISLTINIEPLVKLRKNEDTSADRILEINPIKEDTPDISLYR